MGSDPPMTDPVRAVERVARLSYGRLVARLAARTGSLAAAEDALGDALVRALETWPVRGLPDNPEGWLLAAARNRAVDRVRAERLAVTYGTELGMLGLAADPDAPAGSGDAGRPDHSAPSLDPRLGLMFACAHPAIDPPLRAPLMLQAVLGLDARRMASVYLVPPGTLGQRLTRAKRKIGETAIPLQVPDDPAECATRLADILAALYAAYAIGHDGTGTGDAKASSLAEEALWLVSTLCAALPAAAEAHGLFALMLFTEARRPARIDPATGGLVPLGRQDTALWDPVMLADAERALANARANLSLGRFQLEAAIQAVHADRRRTGRTAWGDLRTLYAGVVRLVPTLGALTGQAVIEAEIDGPAAGLARLDALTDLARAYQPWHAARAHLLARAGHDRAAAEAFDRAIGLCDDPAARTYLTGERARLARPTSRP